ncbi:glycosyltransferase family 4 protein [Rhabdothermincola salaria]|uniref:glycosyltransferase family 4 protein n=1 Tax=Rhabdothermincola salaria TaxID=2903142 RepID=UPI001E3536E1|nr:glycosyltransferase family 4 protein [Rhabdothermincola salaria]MCD9623239.1 glycosyltransferase family 4 protein [Rhabdothermincola salaria]
MRVLYLSAAYLPHVGGIEVLLHQICRQLRDHGHAVEIVSADAPAPDEVDGVRVHRLDVQTPMRARDVRGLHALHRRLREVMTAFRPDVVHSHDMGALLWLHQRATRSSPVPLVVTVHNVMTRHLQGAAGAQVPMGQMLEKADVVTAVSEHALEDTLSYVPALTGRIRYLPNGVPSPPGRESDVVADPRQVVFVGRLTAQKGVDVLLDAMAQVAAVAPDVRLLVVGEGPDGAALRAVASDLGLGGTVRFLGRTGTATVAALMARSALVVMPSRYEGLPLVALEAAWAGRPVLGTRVPGLSEAVVDGGTGVLVAPEDPSALARAMVDLLAAPDRRRELGRAARRRAEQKYGLERCVERYETIYRQLAVPAH